MVKKSLLFYTSQLSSKIEKKRFAHVPSVPSQQNTLNLRPFLHKVTGLSLLSRLTSSPELLSMMVWTNLDLLQERLLNRLLLVVQMLFMASRLETHSIMVTCFSLKILVNNLWNKDTRTQSFCFTPLVVGVRMTMYPLILVCSNIKHSLMMALSQKSTLSLLFGQALCIMVVPLKFYGTHLHALVAVSLTSLLVVTQQVLNIQKIRRRTSMIHGTVKSYSFTRKGCLTVLKYFLSRSLLTIK